MNIQNRIINLHNSAAISALDISPDGSFLVIGQQYLRFSTLANLTLWSLPDVELLTEIERAERAFVKSAIFTYDSKKLLYVKEPEEVSVYDFENQQHWFMGISAQDVVWLARAKNSPRIVTAGRRINVWDLDTSDRAWIWGVPDYTTPADTEPAVADISPDGSKIAVVGNNTNQALIYDIDLGEVVQTLDDAPLAAHWAQFSPDLRYFAALGYYATGIYVWDLETGKRHLPERIFSSDRQACRSLCFHPSSKYLAVGTSGSLVGIYQVSDGDIVALVDVEIGQIEDLVFTPDGKRLFSGGFGGVLSVTELTDFD